MTRAGSFGFPNGIVCAAVVFRPAEAKQRFPWIALKGRLAVNCSLAAIFANAQDYASAVSIKVEQLKMATFASYSLSHRITREPPSPGGANGTDEM
ncbi:Myosin type II heavy chain [Trichuris trichiura]|uniref:Myosin type II heavy chain n=1 Tax=Trichuris trichiura TaxID=36087 RepID=A0A077ZCF7_TRITR|nr:Myosin type II heavy chain [Trichuris trichiura]